MDANLLNYDISFEFWRAEITLVINLPPPRNVQNPPPCNHRHGSQEQTAKPSLKYLKSLRRKIGRLLSCCKALEANKTTGIGEEDRFQFPNKLGFQSRTSAIDRDERVREAIMYCKSTITRDEAISP